MLNATLPLLYPWERDLLPIVQNREWALGSVWTGAENVSHRDAITGPSSP